MARQAINVGTAPNDAGAESIYAAFTKVNAMTGEIYNSRYFNVMDYGTNVGGGNATVDTAAIVAAAAAANVLGVNNAVYFPGGKDYSLNATVAWPPGVHMIGGAGASTNIQLNPSIRWYGTAGGTMFTCQTPGDRVFNQRIAQMQFRSGTSSNIPATAWAFGSTGGNGLDFGSEFNRCWFADFSADCVKYLYGPTNLHIYNCRWDAVRGYAVYIRVSNQTIFSLDKFTVDMGGGIPPIPTLGVCHFEADLASAADKYIVANISNGRIEVNNNPGGQKAVFLCTSGGANMVQHYITGSNLWFPNASSQTDYSAFLPMISGSPGTATDNIMLDIQGLYIGEGRRIGNTITVPPTSGIGWFLPHFSFGPRGYGVASTGAQLLDVNIIQMLIRDLLIGNTGPGGLMSNGRGCIHIANALTVPTTNPTAGGVLYVEGGALKYRGSGGLGTVYTLAAGT